MLQQFYVQNASVISYKADIVYLEDLYDGNVYRLVLKTKPELSN